MSKPQDPRLEEEEESSRKMTLGKKTTRLAGTYTGAWFIMALSIIFLGLHQNDDPHRLGKPGGDQGLTSSCSKTKACGLSQNHQQ